MTAETAQAALPTGPTTTGLTGLRPNATNISFPISDRVQAEVDVATGNLNVSTKGLSLVGVNGTIPLGASYNSRGWQTASSPAGIGNGWTLNLAGAGSLAATSSGVVLTQPDGSTWGLTPISGTSNYSSPAGLKESLVKNSDGTYSLTDWTSRQVTKFDANGNALSVTDKNGNAATINYTSGNATSLVGPAGPSAARTVTLGDDATGFLFTQTNGSSSRHIHYTFEGSSGNITAFTDAAGNTTSFGYSGTDLTSIMSPTGEVTTVSYSGTTHKVAEVDQANTTSGSPGTSTTRFTYPSSTQTLVAGPNTDTSVAVATGPHTEYDINSAQEQVNQAIDPMGRTRSATYNTPSSLDVTSSTTGTGSTATSTTASYGANSNQSLTSVQQQGGSTTSYAYGNSGSTAYLPSSTTSDAGNATKLSYDGAGNQLTSSQGSGATLATSTLTYNTDGTVATALAPGNGTNKTVYSETKYGGGTDHQLTSITPVTGTTLGGQTFNYDAFGRLQAETDGNSNTTSYTYDNDDRVLTTSFSDGSGTVTNTYDADGNLLTQASASGTITNTYDQLSRLISTVNTAGGGTVSYGYDKASNESSMTTTDGTWTNTFDASGVLLVTKYPKSGGYLYTDYATDQNGRRTDTFLQGSSTYANTSPVTVPSSYAGRTTTTYDANGRVGEVKAVTNNAGTLSTVFDTQYCYNSASTTSCSTATSTDRSQLQWAKNLLSGGSLTVYKYDGSGRLLSATQSGGSSNTTWAYTYDLRGNRLSATTSGASTSSQPLSYNAANEITSTGYTYDGAGNLTAAPGWQYTYNAAQQMTTAKNTSTGVTTSYTYAGAAQNAVLSESTPGDHTYNITYGKTDPQGQPEIVKYNVVTSSANSTGDLFADPVTGQATMLTTSSGIVCLYVYDALDNPVGLLTDFATNAVSGTFDPYGVGSLTGSGNGAGQNPYSFKSGIQDRASGLVKFGLRWYNPTTGTWTQRDTLDAPLDPANANRYVFAAGDPINGVDPSGQITQAQACGLAFLGLSVLAAVLTAGVFAGLEAGAAATAAAAGAEAAATGGGSDLISIGVGAVVGVGSVFGC